MEFNVTETEKHTWHIEIRDPSGDFEPLRCSPDFGTRQEALTALADAIRVLVVGRTKGLT